MTQMLRRSLARSAAAFLAIATGSVTPALAADDATFRTPSGGIGCGYYERILRCDVRDGIVPLPPRPKTCDFDWGQGYNLGVHGPARVVCAGDTALNPSAQPVAYGTTWRRDGIACASSTSGLRCTNVDRHGFFLSRGQAYRF